MKKYSKYLLILTLIQLYHYQTKAQEILAIDSGIAILLKQNYGIQMAKNQEEIAANNAHLLNSRYLPSVSVKAGANYALSNTNAELQNGTISSINGADNLGYNTSVGLTYTLFDGLARSNSYKKWQENYALSQIEAREIIESSLVQMFYAYYAVARLTETYENIQSSIWISEHRLLRMQYNFQYGKNTRLDVLNAEVDMNNDKIRFLNIKNDLVNAKHNLNLILGQEIRTDFAPATLVSYSAMLQLDSLLEMAHQKNTALQKLGKSLEISKYTIKENKAAWLPRVDLSGSYGFSTTHYDENNSYSRYSNNGLSAAINLSWNVFDGGTTKTRVQNAKLATENYVLQEAQGKQMVERDILNIWESYQNALFVMQTEIKNLQTAELNFSRSEEQFQMGQISTVEYRVAQVNLLNAKTGYSQAKYGAKIPEIELLQMGGILLETDI